MKKLAIREEPPEHEKYEFKVTARIYEGEESFEVESDPKVNKLSFSCVSGAS